MTASISPEFLALQELLAGRYSIERELGRGGMGIVLLARDVALDRPVAIKLLPPHLATRPDERDRFLQEARIAAGLSHPNIVPIHLVEARGELVFFVMGFVDGETLRDRVERAGPLPPRLATKLLQEVAWALGAAHQRGVIHRDVKPDNIMIERATERAVVTDFGIALGRGAGRKARTGGSVTGTARYMSPEQACGEPVDARSDLYSLGATFFYALTGRAPFEAANLPAILTKHVYEPAPLVHALRPEVPAKLSAVVDRLLRKAPPERFQTADDLARVAGELRGPGLPRPAAGPCLHAERANLDHGPVDVGARWERDGDHRGDPHLSTGRGGAPAHEGWLHVRRHSGGPACRTAGAAGGGRSHQAAQLVPRSWTRCGTGSGPEEPDARSSASRGCGLTATARPALPSVERTELVLGRSVLSAYQALPDAERRQARDLPGVIERLETGAEALRARGDTGESLTEAVAALEHLRLALVKRQSGVGSPSDLTLELERARAIGDHVDRRIAAAAEVQALLE